ncbi:hypothetical protein HK102_010097 [Quaeritorhiza haematococci]|nr:hypothetical protein HK102_010097 [Quaeritorhiza haematococci]
MHLTTALYTAATALLAAPALIHAHPHAQPQVSGPGLVQPVAFEKAWTTPVDIFECKFAGTLALTFDDGPHPVGTPPLLDTLKKHDVKATFFILGTQADQYPDLVKRIWEEGHQIASHTYSHPDIRFLAQRTNSMTPMGLYEELTRTNDALFKITGARPKWLRPPFGNVDAASSAFIKSELKMIVANWNLDTKDWANTDVRPAYAQFLNSSYPNGIVALQHDTKPEPLAGIDEIIKLAKERGFDLTTMYGCNGGVEGGAPAMYLEGSATQPNTKPPAKGPGGRANSAAPQGMSRSTWVMGVLVTFVAGLMAGF